MIEITSIRIYVVNLRRRQDRRELMQRQLGQLPTTYTSDWSGMFDGSTTSRADL